MNGGAMLCRALYGHGAASIEQPPEEMMKKRLIASMLFALAMLSFGSATPALAWSEGFCSGMLRGCLSGCPSSNWNPFKWPCRGACYTSYGICRANPGDDPW
jgi:hypothetical protein